MNWEILEKLPDGWEIDKTTGSPLYLHVWVTNGKSVLNGGKRALLKIHKPILVQEKKADFKLIIDNKKADKSNNETYIFPAKSVNTLARKKFEEHLLKEITFDLMVCEIEKWDKLEYIKELKQLINTIKV